jgi:hypothetical protein
MRQVILGPFMPGGWQPEPVELADELVSAYVNILHTAAKNTG